MRFQLFLVILCLFAYYYVYFIHQRVVGTVAPHSLFVQQQNKYPSLQRIGEPKQSSTGISNGWFRVFSTITYSTTRNHSRNFTTGRREGAFSHLPTFPKQSLSHRKYATSLSEINKECANEHACSTIRTNEREQANNGRNSYKTPLYRKGRIAGDS